MAYIDRDKLKSMTVQKNSIWDSITDSQGRGLSEIIDSIPTIEVVPCMNCKMWEQNKNLPYGNCSYHLSLAYATDWCSWAERREDAETTCNPVPTAKYKDNRTCTCRYSDR